MNNIIETAASGTSPFDSICRIEQGTEFWLGRELMPLLGYQKWERFGSKSTEKYRVSAICRAIISCSTSGNVVEDNFTHFPMRGISLNSVVSDMIPEDWKLSRFACYLVAMNGDVTKPEIAAAQSYFATKTREAEINDRLSPKKVVELHWDKLSEAIEVSIAAAVKKELSNVVEKVYRDYNEASLIASFQHSRIDRDRSAIVNKPKESKSATSKEEQFAQAYTEILEIRDRWCESVGIVKESTGDNAFTQAVQAGKVPEIDRLLKFVKWGTSNGISRGTLRRIRAKLKGGIALRNLVRTKDKKIEKFEGLAEWVRDQRKQHPQEPISCLHRRMQLQHPDKEVSRSTLDRWLETI